MMFNMTEITEGLGNEPKTQKRSNNHLLLWLSLFTFFKHCRPCSSPTPSPTHRKMKDGVSVIAYVQYEGKKMGHQSSYRKQRHFTNKQMHRGW